MDTVWSTKADAILRIGHLIRDPGETSVRNWALTRSQALAALDKFAYEQISVLGGDVYELVGDRLRLSYDNWHCDQEPGETTEAFAKRSISKARTYVATFPEGEVLFAIVPGAHSKD